MNYCRSLALFLILSYALTIRVFGQDNYHNVEETIQYLNDLFEMNEHTDKYSIVSVGNDLIEISTVNLRTKEFVENLEKEGKRIEDFSAMNVLKRNDDGSILVESKQAMRISTMKEFQVQVNQSVPYKDVNLLYFQNVLMLTWNYNDKNWSLSTWNYCSFSFKSSTELHTEALKAWEYLLKEIVKRDDLMSVK